MKVILSYCNFYDIDRMEIIPEIQSVKRDKDGLKTLYEVWWNELNALIKEREEENDYDPLDLNECWLSEEEHRAMITWADGDTKEFYLIEVKDK